MTWTLELPYPPSVNHYYGRTRFGSVYVKPDGKSYRSDVWAMLKQFRVTQATGAVALRVEVYPPDRRKRDLDNITKCLLDALQSGGAYADDSQIADLHLVRREVVSGGRVTVTLEGTR